MVAGLLWVLPDQADAVPSDLQSVNLSGNAQTQVDDLATQAANVQAEIDALDVDLEIYSESYNQLQIQLDEVNVQMVSLRQELDAAQRDHAYRVQKFEDRLCALYKSGGRGDELLDLILASDGIEDLINRVRLAASIANQDQRIVDDLTDSTDKLTKLLDSVDGRKQDQLDLRRQLNSQRDRIETALAARETSLAGIDTEISKILAAERQRQKEEQERLQRAMSAFINGGEVYDGTLPETDSEIVSQFLETVTSYLGVPYVWAGYSVSTGFDCSGFCQYVFNQHGISLPHYSGYQAQMGYPVSLDQIKAGDLVAFGFPVHHVGIYVGDGMFIHAPRTGDVVKISALSERSDLAAIRRFILQPRSGPASGW
jgi:cell wall-associated NlpC family hydrolase